MSGFVVCFRFQPPPRIRWRAALQWQIAQWILIDGNLFVSLRKRRFLNMIITLCTIE